VPCSGFSGTFDGQGCETHNLFINRPNDQYGVVGLFGWVDGGAVIKNIGMVNVTVTGQGTAGGLVGQNGGTVSNCYAAASVTAGGAAGGLIGDNTGTVSSSYSTGTVTGSEGPVGGLVGQNGEGTVSNSYSTGTVTGGVRVGGLVGENGEGTVTNSFWDTETSGRAISRIGTGKTTAEMQDSDTFSGAGWNITAVADPATRNASYIWNIVDGQTYPFLS